MRRREFLKMMAAPPTRKIFTGSPYLAAVTKSGASLYAADLAGYLRCFKGA